MESSGQVYCINFTVFYWRVQDRCGEESRQYPPTQYKALIASGHSAVYFAHKFDLRLLLLDLVLSLVKESEVNVAGEGHL